MFDRDPLETAVAIPPLAWFGCGFFVLCVAGAIALVMWADHAFK